MASKMARSDGMSGSSRKWPRSRSAGALHPERALDAEDEIPLVAEVEVRRREHRPAMSTTRLGSDGTSIMPMKSLSAFM